MIPGKIITENIFPPIANRNFDYIAYRDEYDEDSIIGFGKDEESAKVALLELEFNE